MRNEKLEIRNKKRFLLFFIPNSSFSLCLCAFVRAILAIIIFGSCAGMVQKGGEIVEGSAFRDMNLASYSSDVKAKKVKIELDELRLADGKWVTEVKSSQWPGFTLRGGIPSGNGSFELFEARILSSHVNGWNEFNLEIFGLGFFDNPRKTGGAFGIAGNVERVQISSGSIRLKSSRITGNAALTALRNRRERILALIEWMAGKTGSNTDGGEINGAISGGEKMIFSGPKEFEKYWKSFLFPEKVSRQKRPPEYSTENAQWRRADSVKWNRTYTEAVFPEELWEYRNSGAMLRDWEEALHWMFIEYSWDFILKSFSNTHLDRVK